MRYEVEEYERWQLRRLAVAPGLTGLAQVNGRSGLAFTQIVRSDLQYIEERSLWLDTQILLKTVPTVLSHRFRRLSSQSVTDICQGLWNQSTALLFFLLDYGAGRSATWN